MEITGRRFIVIGGAGFIGSHLTDLLVREPVKEVIVFDKVIRREKIAPAFATGKLRVVEGDVTQAEDVASAMKGIDGVFHLAALPISSCVRIPRLCLEINVLGTFNVMEAAQKAGVKKVVFSSASSVYGDTNELIDEGHPLNARTLYGASKIAAEYFLRAFNDMYGMDYVVLRYMNVYGPNQDGGLVMSVLNRLRQGLAPVIYGDGSQSFDFVHVRDVATANLLAMQSEVSNEIFNIGSGTEASVQDIVSVLLDLTNCPLQPIYKSNEEVLMQRRVGSSAKAERLLGYRAQLSLRAGLKDVVHSLTLGGVV